jgi:glycosyltransferase involved in cell wall biosynthesis
MTSPLYSLITTTQGRVSELERLLESLRAQSFQKMEVVLVDQSSGNELDALIHRFHADLSITRIRMNPCGISVARNEGLRHATGRIVAFPDDDCAYSQGLLGSVAQAFEDQPYLDGVSCLVCDDSGTSSAGGVMQKNSGGLTCSNVWKTAVSCSFFIRRDIVETVGEFDEQLGVGAKSGCWSGEETDWLLRALQHGARIVYRPDFRVLHPQPDFCQLGGIRKAFRYGCGAGRVLRKHRYSTWFVFASIGFQLLRAAGELLRFRPRIALIRVAMAAGRFQTRAL